MQGLFFFAQNLRPERMSMITFDGWDAHLYGNFLPDGQDSLAHFRTKGSKNGVRRFQNPDGSWTPLGLRERKEREGWGSEERKARRAERKEARRARIAAYKEEKRKTNPKNMTDEELQKAINRKKLEAEYRDLSRSPLLKTGEKLVSGYLNYRVKKEEAENARRRMELDNKRVDAEVAKAKERTKQTRMETEKTKADVKGGLLYERKANLKKAKTEYRGTTLRGNIVRAFGTKMNAGLKEKYSKVRQAEGQVAADRYLKKAKAADANSAAKEAARQQRQQKKEQEKQRRRTERLGRQYGLGKGGKLN